MKTIPFDISHLVEGSTLLVEQRPIVRRKYKCQVAVISVKSCRTCPFKEYKAECEKGKVHTFLVVTNPEDPRNAFIKITDFKCNILKHADQLKTLSVGGKK